MGAEPGRITALVYKADGAEFSGIVRGRFVLGLERPCLCQIQGTGSGWREESPCCPFRGLPHRDCLEQGLTSQDRVRRASAASG